MKYIIIIAVCLFSVGFVSFEKLRDKVDVHVVLLAGQSNMAGGGDYELLPEEIKKRIIAVSDRVRISINGKPAAPLSYYDSKPNKKYKMTKRFGPELLMGLTLAEENPNQEYLLVKRSQGGTSLYGAWNPKWTAEKAKELEKGEFKQNLKLYSLHIQDIQKNISELENSGKSFKIIGLGWMQGENDAAHEVSAKSYRNNLKALIASYRKDLNAIEAPFVIGQINSRYGDFIGGPDMVRRAMLKVANSDVNVEMIPTSTDITWLDYPKHSDNVHYNSEGQVRLGTKFAEKIIFLNQKTKR